MRYLLSLSLAGLFLPGAAWAQGKVEPIKIIKLDRKDPVSYSKEVEPIFYKKCITCHSGSVKEGRFDISSYEGLVKGGKRGTAIVPGKSDKSLLWQVAGKFRKPYMPPKGEGELTPEELAIVALWIDQGAKAPSGVRERPPILVDVPPAGVNPVRALAVSPDKSMIVAGRGNEIHVYDANSGTHIRSFIDPSLKTPKGKEVKAAHISLVESMAFSPDGKYVVSGSFQEISIWDPLTGLLRHKITGFAHLVVALAFSNDSKLLATGGGEPTGDGEVRFFEVGSWKQIGQLQNAHSDTVYGLSFSPDGKMIATCSADKFIKTWEVPSGKFIKSFEGHTHHVLDVGWSYDGKMLASAGGDDTVKIWDFEKGEQTRTVKAHNKQVTRLTFINKNNQILTCSGDSQVKVINASNGGIARTLGGNSDFIYAIAASPDGNIIAAGGQEGIVRVYIGNNNNPARSLLPPGAEPNKDQAKKK